MTADMEKDDLATQEMLKMMGEESIAEAGDAPASESDADDLLDALDQLAETDVEPELSEDTPEPPPETPSPEPETTTTATDIDSGEDDLPFTEDEAQTVDELLAEVENTSDTLEDDVSEALETPLEPSDE